jgi:hypothetical protein
MSSEGLCPLDGNSGFINILGNITPLMMSDMTIKTVPITMAYSPSKLNPTITGNIIEEQIDNTLLYRGGRYGLVNTQICSPVHTGYTMSPNMKLAAEIMLTYSPEKMSDNPSAPDGVLLCVPIFLGNTNQNTAYIKRLLGNEDDNGISSLFTEDSPSITYTTCIEYVNKEDGDISTSTLSIFVFLEGIVINQNALSNLNNIFGTGISPNKTIPPFTLSQFLRNGQPTVQSIITEKGTRRVNELSDDGQIYINTISVGEKDFKTRFEIYSPTFYVSGGDKLKEKCELYTPEQYKCVPFNALTDIQGGYVVPEGSTKLSTFLDADKNKKQSLELQYKTPQKEDVEKAVDKFALIIGCTLGFVGGLFGISYLAKKLP